MKYIVCKTFNKKGIDKEFYLKRRTNIEEIEGYLTRDGDKICYKVSQNAYDYFSRNDDDNGLERFDLVNEIIDIIKSLVQEEVEEELDPAQEAYQKIRELHPNFLKPNENIFVFDFYNANIEDLEQIKEVIQ